VVARFAADVKATGLICLSTGKRAKHYENYN
jgi:hypothetical protein